jgi:hypothetical protein
MLRIRTYAVMTGLAVTLSALVPTSQAQVFPGAGPGGGMRGPGPGGMMGMGMGMGPGGGQGGTLMVLLAPSVQKELKLKEDQKAKIYTFTQKMNQKNRDLAQARMFGGNANPQAMMEATRQLRQETDKGLAQILDAKQKERFDQIVLQNEGPLAVARPEIAAKLRLNESQREYVQGVMMEMRKAFVMSMRQSAANGQFNPNQMREFTTQLRKEAVKEIAKVIDRKQQKTFNSMLGTPFDLTKLESETATAEAANTPAADPSKPTADSSKPAADSSKPAADSSKPADIPQSKDAPATAPGTEPAKESAPATDPKVPAAPGSGANP